MSSTFSLNGRIGLSVTDLVSNARKGKVAVDEVADAIDDVDAKTASPTVKTDDKATPELRDVEDTMADIDSTTATAEVEADTSSFDDLIAGGGALLGGAAAAAIVTAFNTGMDRIQAKERIVQQFGLIEEEAEFYGKEAGDIYADGWGDSTTDVLAALALVDTKLVETKQITKHEADEMAEGALVVADVFQKDVGEVIDVVAKMLLNDLAPNAQAALDILATGMQNGADGADDLFESIDEYAQHFDAFGLSGSDMMNLFLTGLQNGQRDTDKLADAVKEMRIRTVEDGDVMDGVYADLGLSADTYREAILAGGDSARTAFGDIIDALSAVDDPVERNRLAIEVMGTQYEDLGPTALDTFQVIGDGWVETTGKVDEMNEAMAETQSEWDKLSRSFSEKGGAFAENFAGGGNVLLDTESALALRAGTQKDTAESFTSLTDGAKDLRGELVLTAEDVEMFEKKAEGARLGVNDLGKELATATDDVEEMARGTNTAVDASEALEEAMANEAEAAEDLQESIDDLIDAKLDLVGGTIAVENASADAREAIQDLAETNADAEASEDDRAQALRDATEAQLDAASAAADYRLDQMEANGEVVTAADRQRTLREELLNVASTLDPDSALRANVLGLVEDIDAIPEEAETQITTNAPSAQQEVDSLVQSLGAIVDKTVTITTKQVSVGTGGNNARAGGGPVQAGVSYLVGEEGQEIFTPDQDGFIHTASNTATAIGNGYTPGAAQFAAASAYSVGAMPGQATASTASPGVATGDTNVYVKIGETELETMIDARIERNNQNEMMVA